jgi:hypothetical protein
MFFILSPRKCDISAAQFSTVMTLSSGTVAITSGWDDLQSTPICREILFSIHGIVIDEICGFFGG